MNNESPQEWFQLNGYHGSSDIISTLKMLHLDKEIIYPHRPLHSMGGIPPVYIDIDGKTRSFPSRLEFLRCMQSILKDVMLREPNTSPEETVFAFTQRHLGDFAAIQIADPVCLSRWGVPASKLSMAACFPDLWAREGNTSELDKDGNVKKRSGSILRGSAVPPRALSGGQRAEFEVSKWSDMLANDISFKAAGNFSLREGGASRLAAELAAEFDFHSQAARSVQLSLDGEGKEEEEEAWIGGVQVGARVVGLKACEEEGFRFGKLSVVMPERELEDGSVAGGELRELEMGAVVAACDSRTLVDLIGGRAEGAMGELREALVNLDVLRTPMHVVRIQMSATGAKQSPADVDSALTALIGSALPSNGNSVVYSLPVPAEDDIAPRLVALNVDAAFGSSLAALGVAPRVATLVYAGLCPPSKEAILEDIKVRVRSPALLQAVETGKYRDEFAVSVSIDQTVSPAIGYGPKFVPSLQAVHKAKKHLPWLEIAGSSYHGETPQECIRDGRVAADLIARRLASSWTSISPLNDVSDNDWMGRGALRMQ